MNKIQTGNTFEERAKFNLQNEGGAFQFSRFSIRVKLILIISSILLASSGGIILFASSFFKGESEVRIQENNLALAQSMAQWMESELRYIKSETHTMALNLLGGASQNRLKANFFRDNPNFFFMGIASSSSSFFGNIYNTSLMKISGIARADIKKLHKLNRSRINECLRGRFIAFNASDRKRTVLGICQTLAGGRAALLYMDPSHIQKNFKTRKYLNIYMVDEKGEIVAHPDPKIALARSNFLEKAIVKTMWQSPVLAGQGRYIDSENNKSYIASYTKLSIVPLGLVVQAEEEIVFEPVRRIRNRNLIIMCIFLLLAVLVLYFFAKILTTPILSLVRASQAVEKGNYNINIVPATGDEVGWLTHSFSNMAKGLGEREKIKDAFGRFVNKEIAERALKGQIKLGGEKKYAAVFFCDLRNFTAMSENMEPEQVVNFLNEYFTKMVACIDRTHGTVDKYIGDAIMAHWGALSIHGNETENAIDGALMMRKGLREFNKENEAKGKAPTRMGSGINTGDVISGQIGSVNRLEYTIIGDAVNLASRIEMLCKPFATDLLISEGSYERVKNIYKVAPMPPVKVKGKEKPLNVYAVLGRKDDPETPANIQALRKLLGIKLDKSKAGSENDPEEKFELQKKNNK